MTKDLVTEFCELFRDSVLYGDFRDDLDNFIKTSECQPQFVEHETLKFLRKNWSNRLFDFCFEHLNHEHPRNSQLDPPEPVDYIQKAQTSWEIRVRKSINGMCTELNVPIARKRSEQATLEIAAKWTELGTDEPGRLLGVKCSDLSSDQGDDSSSSPPQGGDSADHHQPLTSSAPPSASEPAFSYLDDIRPVYASKDFLDVVIALKSPNAAPLTPPPSDSSSSPLNVRPMRLMQVSLCGESLLSLRRRFPELSPSVWNSVGDEESSDRIRIAERILSEGNSAVARTFVAQGCPTVLRGKIWSMLLGTHLNKISDDEYRDLKAGVLNHDLFVDSLIYKDVKLTAANDDHYFVFEDYLYQVLLPFFRDTHVLKHLNRSSATAPSAFIRGHINENEFLLFYPPNGVIPFHGFSMYVAPLCFVYSDVFELYAAFRALYTRYLHRLTAISSHHYGIVAQCWLLESLLAELDLPLMRHLSNVDAPPLRLTFKWLLRAFAGFLGPTQVLQLWDRLLAYESLLLLPVLAVAILIYRRENLMRVDSLQAAEAVLNDLSSIRVVPLLQLTLFGGSAR